MDRTLPADTHKARQGLQALSLLLLEAVPAMFLFEAVKHLSKALQFYGKGEFFGREFVGMLTFALFISLTGRILTAAASLKEENDAFI